MKWVFYVTKSVVMTTKLNEIALSHFHEDVSHTLLFSKSMHNFMMSFPKLYIQYSVDYHYGIKNIFAGYFIDWCLRIRSRAPQV